MTREIIAITGGAGRIASALRPRLARPDRIIRLIDVVEPTEALQPGEEFRRVDVTDQVATVDAIRGARALLHLGGDPSERPWNELASTNVAGTYVALESARLARVRRVLIASSLHAVGFTTFAEAAALPVLPPRPDTLYGASKAAAEALGSVYADRFGLTVVAARIMEFGDRPDPRRGHLTWLSPDDAGRLAEAVISTDASGFHLVWGTSHNTRGTVPLGPGEAIGYLPQDDADVAYPSSTDATVDPAEELIAGDFIDDDHPFAHDWSTLP